MIMKPSEESMFESIRKFILLQEGADENADADLTLKHSRYLIRRLESAQKVIVFYGEKPQPLDSGEPWTPEELWIGKITKDYGQKARDWLKEFEK